MSAKEKEFKFMEFLANYGCTLALFLENVEAEEDGLANFRTEFRAAHTEQELWDLVVRYI